MSELYNTLSATGSFVIPTSSLAVLHASPYYTGLYLGDFVLLFLSLLRFLSLLGLDTSLGQNAIDAAKSQRKAMYDRDDRFESTEQVLNNVRNKAQKH